MAEGSDFGQITITLSRDDFFEVTEALSLRALTSAVVRHHRLAEAFMERWAAARAEEEAWLKKVTDGATNADT